MLTELQTRKLTKLFSMYDECCNGYLCKKDFETIVKKLAGVRNWGLRSPRYVALMSQLELDWKGLDQVADKNHNQQVSIAEWLDYYDIVLNDPQQYEQQVKALMEMVFDVFKPDGENGINQNNWGQLLSVYNVSPVYAPLIFPTLDTEQSGVITRDQMLVMIRDFFYSDDVETPANAMFGPY
ncbi:MAG: EF-hand domain-containing protein [Thermosynechococcaceae cyanobacterium]